MPRSSPPTLNLEQVELLAQTQNPVHELFHLFGIFKKELQYPLGTCWSLFDEFKEIEIKLNGDLSTYIRPKAGDIIRVHRAKINSITKMAEIPVGKNVVMWRSFEEDPEPTSSARHPTVDDDDRRRCKELQHYYTSKVSRIIEFNSQPAPGTLFLTLAGRLEDKHLDSFGHLEMNFCDGTGRHQMRVFAKKSPVEDDVHFITARDMKIGDLFIASNVKYDRATKKLNLSANQQHGRSLRLVHRRSILGIMLNAVLNEATNQENTGTDTHQVTSITNQQPQESGRRRSPRLLSQQQSQQPNDSQMSNSSSGSHQSGSFPAGYQSQQLHLSEASQKRQEQARHASPSRSGSPFVNSTFGAYYQSNSDENSPDYTRLSDLKQKEIGYEFYNIVGQIRAEPRVTSNYGNCVLQLYDGSPHKLQSFYAFEVDRVVPNCVLLQVYSKQKESDTDEHIEKAKRLQEGELILVKNVRASFIGGKIKLELSANKSHDKSINVIDKNSLFGRKFLDIVENPLVDGLDELIDPLSQSTQCTDNFLMEIS